MTTAGTSWLAGVKQKLQRLRSPKMLRRFNFDIVHGCQLRCVGCPNSVLKPKIQFVTLDDFDRCLRNVDVKRVRLLRLFNFGEALLHPDLAGILNKIPGQRWRAEAVEISTNAQVRNVARLEAALKTGVLTALAVSCDGDGTPEAYERLRPPGKWSILMEFMRTVRELRDRHAPGLRLITRTICTDPEAQQRWRSILEPLGWTPDFRDWMPLPQAPGNPIGAQHAAPEKVCYYYRRSFLHVDADGTVIPCCAHPRAFVMGNLKEQRYSEIVTGTRWEDMRRMLMTQRESHPICGSCGL